MNEVLKVLLGGLIAFIGLYWSSKAVDNEKPKVLPTLFALSVLIFLSYLIGVGVLTLVG